MQPQFWRLAWKRGVLTPLLSGLTSEPSTLARGVEQWISSLRDSPVNPSPSPASESTKPTNGTSGPRSLESSKSATQLSFSWRTSQFERLSNHGETFEDWASSCRVPSRVPPPSWVRDILGAGSSFLPTATTSDGSNQGGVAGRVGPKRESLDRLLGTVRASRGGKRKPDGRRGMHLDDQIHGGQVNPRWKEGFMYFPFGWTEL